MLIAQNNNKPWDLIENLLFTSVYDIETWSMWKKGTQYVSIKVFLIFSNLVLFMKYVSINSKSCGGLIQVLHFEETQGCSYKC